MRHARIAYRPVMVERAAYPTTSRSAGDPYVIGLVVAFAILWLLLAIAPRYRADWAIENALTMLCVGALVVSYRRIPLSRTSYTCIALFLSIHSLGAHYTYSEVPYDAWFKAVTGCGLGELIGWRRNNFDRMVHFLYGLLLVYPIREVVVHATGLRGFWGYFLPMDLTMSSSATYELIEWGAAVVFGGDLGVAYVGAQGDPWDAQKDMSLAALGALLSTLAMAAVQRWRNRHQPRSPLPHPPRYA
jgi:putative membrane protein